MSAGSVWRLAKAVLLFLASPLLLALSLAALWITDLVWLLAGRRRPPQDHRPRSRCASIVIPTWNGRDLIEKYLPGVVEAAAGSPENEVIVVDNGSADGTADWVRQHAPGVRVLALARNLGFGGGSSAGVRAARNQIVVLLNNDMRVEPGFLEPLLEGFTDEKVFAVSCQIFLSDPAKRREETGLTEGWWENGGLRVSHREDKEIQTRFPCFYGGGGSCAFDRAKFLELGGFDELYAPFYLEDTDLGYLAWKRGWKVLYEPRSVVWHEHRGTIGRRFPARAIDRVLKRNYLLFAWKHAHGCGRLAESFAFALGVAWLSALAGDSPDWVWAAFRALPRAVPSRWRARRLAVLSDEEAFRRPLAGYFRDRFEAGAGLPEKPRVLFVSPYPVSPPVHGGAVFMNQMARELGRRAEVHLVAALDYPWEEAAHGELETSCASMKFVLRVQGRPKALGSLSPHAVNEFDSADLAWLIHRQIYLHKIDVVQLEYMPLGQYVFEFQRLACALFEHDVYFQSIGRGLAQTRGLWNKLTASWEYLRALHWELPMLRRPDLVQVCSRENREYLARFLPEAAASIDETLRAGIDTASYEYREDGRQEDTLLFLGSFRHLPNQEALEWFARRVMPHVLEKRPAARLVVVGSDPPPRHSLPELGEAAELKGFVPEVREELARYALFVCPVLSGSGVRVKLLEAFASGIPAVSTRLGAEGLAWEDGDVCALADEPEEFARKVVRLLEDPGQARAMARRARAMVERDRDIQVMADRLVARYRDILASKRAPK